MQDYFIPDTLDVPFAGKFTDRQLTDMVNAGAIMIATLAIRRTAECTSANIEQNVS